MSPRAGERALDDPGIDGCKAPALLVFPVGKGGRYDIIGEKIGGTYGIEWEKKKKTAYQQ
jgi:hypothetical protein